ncbi:1070_t:CDS:2 [Paraglomus brasilianum]|uniref:1070_t:CDS:1 n=1 Tax=Paraglomus brasilianum TaxID=144538 RepID=A0A9N9AB98_9GLOM|nr:1070_t:CDS:2 [Paraglomus brasilianum]
MSGWPHHEIDGPNAIYASFLEVDSEALIFECQFEARTGYGDLKHHEHSEGIKF